MAKVARVTFPVVSFFFADDPAFLPRRCEFPAGKPTSRPLRRRPTDHPTEPAPGRAWPHVKKRFRPASPTGPGYRPAYFAYNSQKLHRRPVIRPRPATASMAPGTSDNRSPARAPGAGPHPSIRVWLGSAKTEANLKAETRPTIDPPLSTPAGLTVDLPRGFPIFIQRRTDQKPNNRRRPAHRRPQRTIRPSHNHHILPPAQSNDPSKGFLGSTMYRFYTRRPRHFPLAMQQTWTAQRSVGGPDHA